MPIQRKVFRIEEMLGLAEEAPARAPETSEAARHVEMMTEIRALRAAFGEPNGRSRDGKPDVQRAQAGEAKKLKIELDVIGEAIRQTRNEISTLQVKGFDGARVARVTHELQAVVAGTGQATEQILKGAEDIEELASTLCASLKNGHEQGLAQDIQERVTQIFEACNFHDLTGQRINKVAATLSLVEDHLARMTEIWSVIERFSVAPDPADGVSDQDLLNGPKLEGDAGHSSQDEIDALFH